MSVYISPEGLGTQKYELGASRNNNDPFFRVGRYFTAIYSLASIEWESVNIYLETDPCWKHVKSDIIEKTLLVFPSATIYPYRLSLASQWKSVSESYSSDSIIYLHSNDDHAFVSENNVNFYEMVHQMKSNLHLRLGAVTHHPEMLGLLFRNRSSRRTRVNSVEIGYAIGTTLVRGDFFASWWDGDKFEGQDHIVRPDNPFGKSVTFNQEPMLIPLSEQMRHLDGYSHVGLFRPLVPLRNTVTYKASGNYSSLDVNHWKYGYWPSKLFTVHGVGSDFHRTETRSNDSLIRHVQIGVARIQASCALRISFTRLMSILRNPGDPIHRLAIVPAILIGLLTPCVIRNVSNYFFDFPTLVILNTFNRLSRTSNSFAGRVWYKGLSRAWNFRSGGT